MITAERLMDLRLCDLRKTALAARGMSVDEQQAVWDEARRKVEERLSYLPTGLTEDGFNALTREVIEDFEKCRIFGIDYAKPRVGSLMVAVARYYLNELGL